MDKLRMLVAAICLWTSTLSQLSPNKLCLDSIDFDACQQIERDQDIACQFVPSKADCILHADQGLPVLATLTPEEAFLGAPLVGQQATVIGEIVAANDPYETAVLVRSGFAGGLQNLRGLRYCHPGYSHDELITRYVLEELDRETVALECNGTKTLVERKFEALSLFFGSSCRPGSWTEDEALDVGLKSRYSSLCAGCGSNGCSTRYQVPFNDTLSCLTDNGGDVALTTLRYANAFFQSPSNAQDFQFLCKNGTVSPSSSPCSWTRQIRRLVVTSSASASIMKNYVRNKLPSYVVVDAGAGTAPLGASGTVLEESLARVWKLSRTDKVKLINPTPLSDYVSERRRVPSLNDSTWCDSAVRWSVETDGELGKCRWLQRAALNVGLQPVVSCVKSPDADSVSSLDDIKNGYADVTFVDANFGYIARKKNLTNVAYLETDIRQLSHILLVIKNDTQNINGLRDLKGKRICIPEYGGKEWLALVDLLRDNKIVDNSCDYGKLFSDFVGSSCAPGANAKDYDIANTDQDKLCENCVPVSATAPAKYCSADSGNKYYDSFGALKCLEDDNGDYAVISLNDLPRAFLDDPAAQAYFRVISRNGSLAGYAGFRVDDGAPLTIITAGEVVIKNGNPNYDDVVLLLRSVEREFGQNLEKPFKVFESFNGTQNLLFPDSTPGLTFGGSPNKYIEQFKKLLANAATCASNFDPVSSSDSIAPALLAIVVLNFLAYII